MHAFKERSSPALDMSFAVVVEVVGIVLVDAAGELHGWMNKYAPHLEHVKAGAGLTMSICR